MVLDTVIALTLIVLEPVGIVVGDSTSTVSATDGLLAIRAAEKHFDVDHVVLVDHLRVVQGCAVEDQVAWLGLLPWDVDWTCVPLVALITPAKFETKFLLEVVDGSPNEAAAVEEHL